MKNTILAFVAGCVSAAIFPGQVFPQGTGNPPDLASTQITNAPAPAAGLSGTSPNTADASALSMKVTKDFKRRFTKAKSEKWYVVDRVITVCFMEDGYKCRALYDKKGRWLHSIKYFDEKKLPRDLRNVVKSAYFDMAITLVEVVQVPDHLMYVVHLEDPANIKIVKVSEEGEMEMYKEFSKN